MSMADILYIHPHGHLVNDNIIPTGAITCVNSYSGSKIGVFSHELNDEMIAEARVIAIDFFWASSYMAVEAIVSRIRTVNPFIPIIIGGLTSAIMPGMIKKYLNSDYVLSALHNERSFQRIVEFHSAPENTDWNKLLPAADYELGYNTSPEINSLDPLTLSWFRSSAKIFQIGIHLGRICNNRSDRCFRCVVQRSGDKNRTRILYDNARVEELINLCPEHTEFFLSGLHEEDISSLLPVFQKYPHRKKLCILTCGRLPADIINFLDSCRNPDFFLFHMVPWHPDDWKKVADRNKQFEILAELALRIQKGDSQRISLFKSVGNLDESSAVMENMIKEYIPQTSLFSFPLNWKMLDYLSDTEESLNEVRSFSKLVTRTLILRHLSPFHFNHYKFGEDPQLELPAGLCSGEDPFLCSLKKGLARWKTILPDEITYRIVLVRRTDNNTGSFNSSPIPVRDFIFLWDLWDEDCSISVTATGWEITVPLPEKDVEDSASGFIVIPRGLEPGLPGDGKIEIPVFPLPRESGYRTCTITIRGDRKTLENRQ